MTDPTIHPAAEQAPSPPPDPGNSPPEQWALDLRYEDTDLDALIDAAADPHALDPLLQHVADQEAI